MSTINVRDARPGLGRLTAVELRKMTDTRAGLWLQVVVVLTTLVATLFVAIVGNAPDGDHDFDTLLSVAVAPSSILLPIVGILLITSEWTQRTALVTFALVPDRRRVLGAKLLAGAALALAAFVLCVAFALAVTAVAGDGSFSIPAELLGQTLLSVVIGMTGGVAFGAAFLASAPAIVSYFVLPTVVAALSAFSFLESVGRWIDITQAQAPITDEVMDGTQWARFGVNLALWFGVPLALGAYRILRGEVK